MSVQHNTTSLRNITDRANYLHEECGYSDVNALLEALLGHYGYEDRKAAYLEGIHFAGSCDDGIPIVAAQEAFKAFERRRTEKANG